VSVFNYLWPSLFHLPISITAVVTQRTNAQSALTVCWRKIELTGIGVLARKWRSFFRLRAMQIYSWSGNSVPSAFCSDVDQYGSRSGRRRDCSEARMAGRFSRQPIRGPQFFVTRRAITSGVEPNRCPTIENRFGRATAFRDEVPTIKCGKCASHRQQIIVPPRGVMRLTSARPVDSQNGGTASTCAGAFFFGRGG